MTSLLCCALFAPADKGVKKSIDKRVTCKDEKNQTIIEELRVR